VLGDKYLDKGLCFNRAHFDALGDNTHDVGETVAICFGHFTPRDTILACRLSILGIDKDTHALMVDFTLNATTIQWSVILSRLTRISFLGSLAAMCLPCFTPNISVIAPVEMLTIK